MNVKGNIKDHNVDITKNYGKRADTGKGGIRNCNINMTKSCFTKGKKSTILKVDKEIRNASGGGVRDDRMDNRRPCCCLWSRNCSQERDA